jgi:FtsP/CotA-like multicopper oxidase with cupredoxin domain
MPEKPTHHATHAPAGAAGPQPASGHGRGGSGLDHTRGAPSRAAIAGHPLHAMLIPFPIAFLLGAFGADLAAWWTADPFWARAALWLTGAGVVTGGLAALFGLVDFLTIERARVHTVGWVHALAAGTTLALAAASWLLRLGDPVAVPPLGLALSALTAAALAVTGWAGGDLPYRHLIGVTGHGGHEGGHAAERTSAPAAGAEGRGAGEQAGNAQGSTGHAGMAHAETDPAYAVTGPQLAAVSLLTLLALAAAVVWAASDVNLTYSARQVGGAVMPPGMIQTRDLPAEAMRDMAAVDLRQVRYTAPADARGDQPLEPRSEGGVKVFDLDVSVIRWNILPYARVAAYAFNRQVPGPRIRVVEGDRVRINVTNDLPEPTTVHWHGLILPNAMDGPSQITQAPIPPGGRYVYEFTARQRGTFFYHSHHEADRQQALGMYGALIIDPRDRSATPAYDKELLVQLQEWTFKEGYTFPAMPMEGAMPNFFTINGKAYPATETVSMKVGERLRIRFIGSNGAFIHPMHVHGGPFRIIETDGQPVPEAAQVEKDTVNVGPGERYDVIWEAREPGKWLLHCHINHHMTNNNREEQGGGGLTLVLEVS